MAEQVFIIMQIGAKDSPERKRADEIYNFIIAPAVKNAGLEAYRSDLDLSPGAVTPKMISELLSAKVVIADLTGRNPNVFYELGITHSFTRPLISIADSTKSLPFDTKDQRVIEIGEYPSTGLTYSQGEQAKASLQQSLSIVLAEDYTPPSPLREVAANRSVDQLAPKDPVAAEMAQIRESLEDIRQKIGPRRTINPTPHLAEDIRVLRKVIERNAGYLDEEDFNILRTENTSGAQDTWATDLEEKMNRERNSDPWASDTEENQTRQNVYSDDPPF